MKGATGAADELARFLAELTAALTVREMAQRYGGGKTTWGEYRSGTRIIPLGRLNAVVRDLVRDGQGRESMLRRARRLHDAALIAAAEAEPPLRLDEALRRAEADLAESERIVRQLATVIATLLAEQDAAAERPRQAGPAEDTSPAEPEPAPKSQPATGPTPALAIGRGLLDRAMEQLAAVWAVREAARRIMSLRGAAPSGVPRAYGPRELPLGITGSAGTAGTTGMALELARTADVLEHVRWEVWRLEQDVDEEGRTYEGVVLERTDRPTTAPAVWTPPATPALGSTAPLVVSAPPAVRAAPARAGFVAAAVLGVVSLAAAVLVVLGGRQPLIVPVGAGPVQPHAPAPTGPPNGAAPGPTPPSTGPPASSPVSPSAPAGPIPAPTPSAPGRTPLPAPPPATAGPTSTAPTPPSPTAPVPPPAGAEPSIPAAGLIRLTNVGSRRCLAVPHDSTTPADHLPLTDCGDEHEQLWHLTKESAGTAGTVYSIRNRFSGLCLSVDAARVTNDAAVTQYLCGDRQGLFPDQLWRMQFHTASDAWQLVNVNSGKCVAAPVGGEANERASQQDCREDPWLAWQV